MTGLKGRRILVTGAEGFIGSHLVEALVREGARVRGLVLYNSFNSWGWLDHVDPAVRKEIEVVLGDIRDPLSARSAMEGCSAVLHLAALIAIPYSYAAPESYVETNVRGTLNMLQAAREAGIERFIHTSTSEVYGSARFVPISEEHPLQAQSPYAASKIGADQIALSYQRSFGVPVTVLRPFNTYGPRQSARAIIPTIITQIAAGERVLKLGNLRPTRDLSYVTDTAAGFVRALECDEALGDVVNIGSGFEISIGDLVALIAEEMGASVEIQSEQARMRPAESEVERLWSDTAKAGKLFGWSPEHGGKEGLREGLKKTITWFSNPANLALYKHDIYNT